MFLDTIYSIFNFSMLNVNIFLISATQMMYLSVLARNPLKGPVGEISLEAGRGGGREGPGDDKVS